MQIILAEILNVRYVCTSYGYFSFSLKISTKVTQLCVCFMNKEKSGKIFFSIFKVRYIPCATILLPRKLNVIKPLSYAGANFSSLMRV